MNQTVGAEMSSKCMWWQGSPTPTSQWWDDKRHPFPLALFSITGDLEAYKNCQNYLKNFV